MVDTLKNIELPPGVWVDLYATSGLIVGTQIVIENLTNRQIKFHISNMQPSGDAQNDNSTGAYNIIQGFASKMNEKNDSGAWVYSDSLGLVNVREV